MKEAVQESRARSWASSSTCSCSNFIPPTRSVSSEYKMVGGSKRGCKGLGGAWHLGRLGGWRGSDEDGDEQGANPKSLGF